MLCPRALCFDVVLYCRKTLCEEPFGDGSSVSVRASLTRTLPLTMHPFTRWRRHSYIQPMNTRVQPKDFCCICGGGVGNGGRCITGNRVDSTTQHTALTPLPTDSVSGVPPWNNKGCKFQYLGDQLRTVNPNPERGGKDTWHPPSKQVRYGVSFAAASVCSLLQFVGRLFQAPPMPCRRGVVIRPPNHP